MLIQSYRVIKQIGQGGFGKTFLVVDESQSPPILCVIKQWSQDQKEFQLEALRLEELGSHPQIPKLIAYFEQDLCFYLVQEFVDGNNLARIMEEEGAFSEARIWQILDNLLPVLEFIHDRQIIHRDIKPENIIRRHSDGQLILVDFGAAKLVSEIDQYQTGISIGSPQYAAPEQARGKAVFASDLYSLGLTCIHLLTQIPPFDLFDVTNNCWAWRQYLIVGVSVSGSAGVSHHLSRILDKLIQNDVSRRFQSADEVMQAINGQTKLPPKVQTSPWQCLNTITATEIGGVNSIAISPPLEADKFLLASGSDDKTIRLWHLDTKQARTSPIATLHGHSHAVVSVAFSPDGRILATGSDDKTIKLWDINTSQEICTLSGHSRPVKSVSFSPDGEILASGSWDKTIKLWHVKSGKEVCSLKGHQLQVTAVAFSPQSEANSLPLLASASFDRTVRLWEPVSEGAIAVNSSQVTYRNRYTFSDHAWAVLSVAFSPNGKVLATGSDDRTIKLWDVNTGQIINTFSGHSWSVVALAFSSDGEMLISGSCDKTLKLWKVSTGQVIAIAEHSDSISAVAVCPSTQLIASSSKDKTIKLWISPDI